MITSKATHAQRCETYRNLGETLAKSAVARGFDAKTASNLARKISSLADREISQITGTGSVPLACRKGCHHCCQLMPTAAAAELVPILKTVAGWADEQQHQLRVRLREYVQEAEFERNERFLRFRKDRPFLTEGECSIYEVRPLFCRGSSSENPELCRAFNEDPNAEEVFGPNGELGLAQAIISGLTTGSASPPNRARVEVPGAILRLLENPNELPAVLQEPRMLLKNAQRNWLVIQTPSGRDILADKIEDENCWIAVDQRRRRPYHEVLHLIQRPTTANALAKIFMPSVFNSTDEMEAAWHRFQAAIDDAWDFTGWDPKEAFRAMLDFRPIGAAYQPHSMTHAMRKIGSLIHASR